MIKTVITFSVLTSIVITLIQNNYHTAPEMPAELPVVALPGGDDYRSAQLTYDQMDTLLASGAIEAVIRLNGDAGDDGNILSVDDEQVLCAMMVDFYRFDAHSANDRLSILKIMNEKRTLIHCRHGVHRTGAVVGQYLQRKGFSKDEIISHLGWEKYLQQWRKPFHKYYWTAITPE